MHFGSYHPAINFLFFGAVIVSAALFNQPVFLAVGYGCAFFYAVLLNGRRGAVFNLPMCISDSLWDDAGAGTGENAGRRDENRGKRQKGGYCGRLAVCGFRRSGGSH